MCMLCQMRNTLAAIECLLQMSFEEPLQAGIFSQELHASPYFAT